MYDKLSALYLLASNNYYKVIVWDMEYFIKWIKICKKLNMKLE